MGFMRDPHPRAEELLGGPSAFNMGMTAENIHDRYPQFTKEMADAYAKACQEKTDRIVAVPPLNHGILHTGVCGVGFPQRHGQHRAVYDMKQSDGQDERAL